MKQSSRIKTILLPALTFTLMSAALYMVFVYVPTDVNSGVTQRIFYFHVPLAWISFLAFFITFIFSILYLVKRKPEYDSIACTSAEIGIIFTSLVLITGPIWAKQAWGIWWTWDARLTTSLVLWLIYVSYFLVRSYAKEKDRAARFGAVIGIIGFLDVPIVFLTVNLWRTQHPDLLVFEGGLAAPMVTTLILCITAFSALYLVLLLHGTGTRNMENELEVLKNQIDTEG